MRKKITFFQANNTGNVCCISFSMDRRNGHQDGYYLYPQRSQTLIRNKSVSIMSEDNKKKRWRITRFG